MQTDPQTAMGVVSFRLSEEDERFLRQQVDNPSAFCRKVIEDEIQRRRRGDWLDWLQAIAVEPEKPSEVEVHEDRDSH